MQKVVGLNLITITCAMCIEMEMCRLAGRHAVDNDESIGDQ